MDEREQDDDLAQTGGAGSVAEPDTAADDGPQTVARILHEERERQGLSRAEISKQTKISERHLIAMESGDFSVLPSRTYVIGFVRSYARMLGLDEEKTVARVREELGMIERAQPERDLGHLEPGDPARNPSGRLAWMVGIGLLAALILVIVVWRGFFVPAAQLPPLAEETAAVASGADTPGAPSAAATPAPAPDGAVTFTATIDGVWVKFYDASGKQLFQKEMALGESYTVPPGTTGPQLWTGRPDALAVAIGGRKVAPLATGEGVVRDIPVDAASLSARPPGPGLPARTP